MRHDGARHIGWPRAHYRLTGSTNERARELALRGAPCGTTVTAAEQSAGRGRQGRAWSAAPGRALLMSVLLRGLEEHHALLPLAAATAVCDACEAAAAVECRIKWPNDVWIERRKVAGILIEGRPQEKWVVVGIGINVCTRPEEFPEELRETATSLRIAGGDSAPSLDALLGLALDALERRLADSPSAILEAWRRRDALHGELVRWHDGEGTAAGIDESGALIVETAGGRVALDAGEVHLLR
jgi:BirA family transcriptional regulator, biotin operon repressor / biotin---[acetyl-CoA-carboxylase] ligase